MSSPSGTIEITHFSGLYLWEKILWPESSGMISRLTYFAIKNHSAMPSFWPWKNATQWRQRVWIGFTKTDLNSRVHHCFLTGFSRGKFYGEQNWNTRNKDSCLSSPMEESHSIFVGDVGDVGDVFPMYLWSLSGSRSTNSPSTSTILHWMVTVSKWS